MFRGEIKLLQEKKKSLLFVYILKKIAVSWANEW